MGFNKEAFMDYVSCMSNPIYCFTFGKIWDIEVATELVLESLCKKIHLF